MTNISDNTFTAVTEVVIKCVLYVLNKKVLLEKVNKI